MAFELRIFTSFSTRTHGNGTARAVARPNAGYWSVLRSPVIVISQET